MQVFTVFLYHVFICDNCPYILVMYLADLGKEIKYFEVCVKYFEFVDEELLNDVLGIWKAKNNCIQFGLGVRT